MKYIQHLIVATRQVRASLKHPVHQAIFSGIYSFKRNPQTLDLSPMLDYQKTIESYVERLSQMPKYSGFYLDALNGNRVKDPELLVQSKDAAKQAKEVLGAELRSIREDLVNAGLASNKSPVLDMSIIKMVESSFFCDMATAQAKKSSAVSARKFPKSDVALDPKIDVSNFLASTILSCQGEPLYNEDRVSALELASGDIFHASLKLEEDLYSLHFNKDKLRQGGTTYCGIITNKQHKIVQNCGDSIALYVNVALTGDDKVLVRLRRLNPLHEFEEDSYFNDLVQSFGGKLFNKQEFVTPRLNGTRMALLGMGDHELGLTDFCQINTMIYPNFSQGLNPKSAHFTILASDGILYDGKSEYDYINLIREYFESNRDNLQVIIKGTDNKAKSEILAQLGEMIVSQAVNTGKDNVSLAIEAVSPTIHSEALDPDSITITVLTDGHNGVDAAEKVQGVVAMRQKNPNSRVVAKQSVAIDVGTQEERTK